jgi:hypothetical protein
MGIDAPLLGRGGSTGVRNFRQALASPHPGFLRTVHDPAATEPVQVEDMQ